MKGENSGKRRERLKEMSDRYRADDDRRIRYHWMLKVKYIHAAHYPWLPLAPDPPEPGF